MEYKKFILKNLSYLTRLSRVSEMVIILSHGKSVITTEETRKLRQETSGMLDRNLCYWNIVMTKKKVFETVMWIFQETRQSDIVELLRNAERDDGLDKKYSFPSTMKPLTVAVKQSLVPVKFENDFYKLDRDRIGVALILNITEYSDSESHFRPDARKDTFYMSEIWQQLGYQIFVMDGFVSKVDVMDNINKIKAKVKQIDCYQSLVVFIGGHGQKDGFTTSDGLHVNFWDVILPFANEESFNSKPKIFIFNTCNVNVDISAENIGNHLKNTFVCYPSLPEGELEVHYSRLGSLFVHTLTEVFMNEAYRTELIQLVEMVSEKMSTVVEGAHLRYKFFEMGTMYFNLSLNATYDSGL